MLIGGNPAAQSAFRELRGNKRACRLALAGIGLVRRDSAELVVPPARVATAPPTLALWSRFGRRYWVVAESDFELAVTFMRLNHYGNRDLSESFVAGTRGLCHATVDALANVVTAFRTAKDAEAFTEPFRVTDVATVESMLALTVEVFQAMSDEKLERVLLSRVLDECQNIINGTISFGENKDLYPSVRNAAVSTVLLFMERYTHDGEERVGERR